MEKEKYLVALIISLVTFISGLFLGLALAKKDIYIVGINENNLKANLFEMETTIKFLKQNICNEKLLEDFGLDLDKVGESLESLSNKLFISKEEYIPLISFYYSLEINHYLLLKEAEKQCNKTFIFIFYFYKPIEECKRCYEEGLYLTVLKKKYKNLVEIYSFNMEYYNDSILLKKLIKKYNLNINTKDPILVINNKVYGFLNLKELENITKLSLNSVN